MIVNQRSLYLFRLLSDLLLIIAAFVLAAGLAQPWQTLFEHYYMFFLLVGLIILWVISTNITGFYNDFHSRNFPIQFINLLKETVAQIIASIIFIFLLKENLFTRNFIVYYTILLMLFISLRIIVFRKVLKSLRRKGKNIRNLLILGNNEIARNFKSMINSNPDFGYNLIGLVSERKDESDENIVGSFDQLEKLISDHKVDEAVIAVTGKSSDFLDDIIKICNRLAVRTHIIPDYFKFLSSRFQVSMFGSFPIITARREPLDEAHWRFIKRSFDIVFSFLIIIFVFTWFYPLIFILSKITSPGPVLFLQDRVGAKNQKFKCYKFRTMKLTKTIPTEKFKPVTENDPRVTKLGRFLRRSNLDELPQFINVFKGEMSVVGPRPHAVQYDQVYGKIVDEIRLRYNVKPGITGWAQIHGLRGDVPDEEENRKRTRKRIEYDIWYIENWSLTLDFQIILITIWHMLRGKSKGV